jgi:hypothetical protein
MLHAEREMGALLGLWGDFSLARIAATLSTFDEAGGLSETVQDGE